MSSRDRRHRNQAFASGAAHQIQKKRFDTIFAVVRQSDFVNPCSWTRVVKEFLPRARARGLDVSRASAIATRYEKQGIPSLLPGP